MSTFNLGNKIVKLGDAIGYKNHYNDIVRYGVITLFYTPKRIGVLKTSTTTGRITSFTLRKNGQWIEQGQSIDDLGANKLIL